MRVHVLFPDSGNARDFSEDDLLAGRVALFVRQARVVFGARVRLAFEPEPGDGEALARRIALSDAYAEL